MDIIGHSAYYDNDKLINEMTNKRNSYKIISLNCQSINAKIDNLKLVLNQYADSDCELQAICLQETWLADDSDTSLLQLDGYHLISKGKTCSSHGGLLIYLKNNLKFEIIDIINDCNIWEEQFIRLCKNNLKDTWVAINEVICRNYRTNLPEIFKINGKSVKDNQIIADESNAFFSNIGKKLASEINRNTDVNYAQFLNNPCLLNLNFHAISTESILKVIDKLSSKNSQGHDGVSTKLLKSIKCEASEPITIIINQTFRTGIFPDKLKLAKVIPIFKKGDNTTMNNYRPISILPTVSKVFERIIFDQTYEHFKANGLFYASQYGFQKNHCTELAVLELVDRITQ